ncbi:hypothetical protein [Pandoraea pnomenusa]|uniref:hypothetical protein n=1 Tax=Pandoraea pnomenusa TaxID=93220 RepID=UPI001ACE5BB1|nr:hypothetical protein [Pandoraea pnomenusa]MBN9093886.1 hypothetical protein [Pandoraea pnomenusa]
MLKKLERDVVAADLSAVEALLADRTVDEDPSGVFQLTARRDELREALAQLNESHDLHAAMAVYFGGGPVQGSRGINADFAGGALEDIQELVRKRLSNVEIGPLAAKGPVRLSNNSQLLVTNVARGSFGFILEEAGNDAPVIETALKLVVDDVANLIHGIATTDQQEFVETAANLDGRILISLKQFFKRLSENDATMRVVEGDREFLLDRAAVDRARQRTEAIVIDERPTQFDGTLYLLPESRRFELHTNIDGEGTVIRGPVEREVLRQLSGQADLNQQPIDPREIPRSPWRVLVRVREIREQGREPRWAYSLAKLVQRR